VTPLRDASWAEIDGLREAVGASAPTSIEAAAGTFANSFSVAFSDIVLVRLFIVVPVARVPATERAFAAKLAGDDPRFAPTTRTLTLLGTRGREAAWNDRRASRGHLCIPLIDRTFVEAAPMIAKLLADIDVDLAAFDDGRPIVTRKLLGGKNGMFYVPDATTAVDSRGRYVIADRTFVEKQGIRTVFGMGGAYLDGTLVTALIFVADKIPQLQVDRFPSLISNFKMATAKLAEEGRLFSGAGSSAG
jgi:hypothetical protein